MIESLFLLSSFLSLYSPLRPSPCSSNQSMAMADEQVMLTQIAHLSVQNKEVDMMGETNYVGSSSSSSSKCSDSTTICGSGSGNGSGHGDGVCVICMDKTPLQETALVKGCEHAYCVICILRWATYNQNPSCPQCKLPFLFLNVHRSLDGRIHDYMFEESVCLLLRATWFVPVPLVPQEENCDDLDDIYHYAEYEDEDDDDDLDDIYFNRSPSLRIGNRRWGDNGYVRAGRKEARPINRESHQVPEAGSSSGSKQKEVAKEATGRRAKRALKREAADKAAAEKHIKHLQRFGRK